MNRKTYPFVRRVIVLFVGVIVATAVVRNSYLLALVGIFTGMFFLFLSKATAKIKTDEREVTVQEKAARMTYAIFAPTIGIVSLLLLIPAKGGLAIFSKGEWLYVEALGMILAYLTFFLITIYGISYHYFSRKMGGNTDE
jgi:uncharacterized membrane protein